MIHRNSEFRAYALIRRKHETQSCSESCVFSFSNPILIYIYIFFYDKCKILSYTYYFLAEAEMSIIMFSPHKLCGEEQFPQLCAIVASAFGHTGSNLLNFLGPSQTFPL